MKVIFLKPTLLFGVSTSPLGSHIQSIMARQVAHPRPLELRR